MHRHIYINIQNYKTKIHWPSPWNLRCQWSCTRILLLIQSQTHISFSKPRTLSARFQPVMAIACLTSCIASQSGCQERKNKTKQQNNLNVPQGIQLMPAACWRNVEQHIPEAWFTCITQAIKTGISALTSSSNCIHFKIYSKSLTIHKFQNNFLLQLLCIFRHPHPDAKIHHQQLIAP